MLSNAAGSQRLCAQLTRRAMDIILHNASALHGPPRAEISAINPPAGARPQTYSATEILALAAAVHNEQAPEAARELALIGLKLLRATGGSDGRIAMALADLRQAGLTLPAADLETVFRQNLPKGKDTEPRHTATPPALLQRTTSVVPITPASRPLDLGAPPDDLHGILNWYEKWLTTTAMRGSSRRVHLSRLKQFRLFLNDKENRGAQLAYCDLPAVLNEFLIERKANQDFQPSTVNNFVSTFRLLAKLTDHNTQEYVYDRSAGELKRRRHLSVADRDTFLECSRKTSSIRDYLLALLFSATDINIGECAALKMSDITKDDGALTLSVDRRGRRKFLQLDAQVQSALQDWLDERSMSPVTVRSEFVFPGAGGGKLSTSAIDMVLRKIGWRAGLNLSARSLKSRY